MQRSLVDKRFGETCLYQITERHISGKRYLTYLGSVQTRVGRSCCLSATTPSHRK